MPRQSEISSWTSASELFDDSFLMLTDVSSENFGERTQSWIRSFQMPKMNFVMPSKSFPIQWIKILVVD